MSRTRRYRLVGAVILLPQVVLMSLWYCLNRELLIFVLLTERASLSRYSYA